MKQRNPYLKVYLIDVLYSLTKRWFLEPLQERSERNTG